MKEIKQTITKSMLENENGQGVTIIYSNGGQTKAKLQTKTFDHQQSREPFYFEMKNGLRVDFYGDSLKNESTLTAKYGKYFEKEGDMVVRDSVVVFNNKKEQLNTEELVWNEKQQKFRSDKFVKITTPTQVIYGHGLESNQNFSEYKIINVQGIIGVNKNSLPGQ
jgi:LPS export ABC transporter protein LptC